MQILDGMRHELPVTETPAIGPSGMFQDILLILVPSVARKFAISRVAIETPTVLLGNEEKDSRQGHRLLFVVGAYP
jgi:hypothetical protein